jgi:transposase
MGVETVQALIGDYRGGMIGKEVAKKYGVSLSRLRRLLKKHGGRLKD